MVNFSAPAVPEGCQAVQLHQARRADVSCEDLSITPGHPGTVLPWRPAPVSSLLTPLVIRWGCAWVGGPACAPHCGQQCQPKAFDYRDSALQLVYVGSYMHCSHDLSL